MEYFKLSNNIEIPKIGFGVYQIAKEDTARCVYDAIKVGYRLIDTAQSYFNEEEVGDGIAKAITDGIVRREELFVTSKIWIDNYGYENCKKSIEVSLQKLKLDYLDLMILHQPFADYYGAYRALEEYYEKGIFKAIGVSNFYPDRLSDICLFERKVVPHINQVEVNVLNQQIEAQENMKNFGVTMEAWAPFAEGRNEMFSNPILAKIGEKHNKTIAQVILRWLIQRNVVALAKTTKIERMQENIDIFDFELSNEDMQTIASLDTKTSSFFSHYDPNMVKWFSDIVVSRRTNNDHSKDKKNW